tara:strand:+ start:234 stop:455 length:222 start_codon:yes stop_codon:yes gene_type:complete
MVEQKETTSDILSIPVTFYNVFISALGILWWVSVWGVASEIIYINVKKRKYVIYLILGLSIIVASKLFNLRIL